MAYDKKTIFLTPLTFISINTFAADQQLRRRVGVGEELPSEGGVRQVVQREESACQKIDRKKRECCNPVARYNWMFCGLICCGCLFDYWLDSDD